MGDRPGMHTRRRPPEGKNGITVGLKGNRYRYPWDGVPERRWQRVGIGEWREKRRLSNTRGGYLNRGIPSSHLILYSPMERKSTRASTSNMRAIIAVRKVKVITAFTGVWIRLVYLRWLSFDWWATRRREVVPVSSHWFSPTIRRWDHHQPLHTHNEEERREHPSEMGSILSTIHWKFQLIDWHQWSYFAQKEVF